MNTPIPDILVDDDAPWLPRASFHAQDLLKRILDLALVLGTLPFSLPVLALVAAAVKLDSPGPLLFSQPQMGRHGRTIRPLKFRSMQVGAEAILQKILAEDGPLAREYRQFHKMKQDPRVTRVGRILRKTSLDELPQLWNVLTGDMSLVGPRPYIPRERFAMLGREELILSLKPGITGFWQVYGRNATTFRKRVQMDTHYVRRWSLGLDLWILARTLWVVIGSRGAH